MNAEEIEILLLLFTPDERARLYVMLLAFLFHEFGGQV